MIPSSCFSVSGARVGTLEKGIGRSKQAFPEKEEGDASLLPLQSCKNIESLIFFYFLIP